MAGPDVLTPQQVAHWRRHGWLVVDGLWPEELVAAAAAAAQDLWPESGARPGSVRVGLPGQANETPPSAREAELEAEIWRLRGLVGSMTDGRGPDCSFPFDYREADALNQQTLHPRFLRAVHQLLGTEAVRVTQSSLHRAVGDREFGGRVFSNDRGHHQDYVRCFLAPSRLRPQASLRVEELPAA